METFSQFLPIIIIILLSYGGYKLYKNDRDRSKRVIEENIKRKLLKEQELESLKKSDPERYEKEMNEKQEYNSKKFLELKLWKTIRKGIYISLIISFFVSTMIQVNFSNGSLTFGHLVFNFYVSRWFVKRKIKKGDEIKQPILMGIGVSLILYSIQIILGILVGVFILN